MEMKQIPKRQILRISRIDALAVIESHKERLIPMKRRTFNRDTAGDTELGDVLPQTARKSSISWL